MKGINDRDFMQMKRVRECYEMKNKCDYDDLYVKDNKLSQAYIFEKFWNMCYKVFEFDLALTIISRACITLLSGLLIH